MGTNHLEAPSTFWRPTTDKAGNCARLIRLFIFIGAEPCTEWLDGLVDA